jgi:hypothetical protein
MFSIPSTKKHCKSGIHIQKYTLKTYSMTPFNKKYTVNQVYTSRRNFENSLYATSSFHRKYTVNCPLINQEDI